MGRLAAAGTALALISALRAAGAGIPEVQDGSDPGGISSIEVRAGTVAVEVMPGETPAPVLESTPCAEFSRDEVPRGLLREEREGSRLYAWVEGAGCGGPDGSARVRVLLPPGSSVDVFTTSGNVSVTGLRGGTCRVHTVSGRVELSRDWCDIRADSVSGDIEIDSTRGAVHARTVSGRIDGGALTLLSDSEFFSVSGPIGIGLVSDVEDYAFDLASASGPVTVGTIRVDRGLRMGFGKTRVRGRTISGAISFSGTGSPADSGLAGRR